MKKLSLINFILLVCVLFYLIYNQTKKQATHFKKLTAERIDVVGENGNKFIVLSNPKNQALATTNGKLTNPESTERNTPGLIFFNSEGDEVGGLVFDKDEEGTYQMLTFDQNKNDQIMVLRKDEYEENGQWFRQYGLEISERSEKPYIEIIKEYNFINKLEDSVKRAHEFNKFWSNSEHFAPKRLFLGRLENLNTGLFLLDKENNIKLSIYVDSYGKPVLQYVDSLGNNKNLLK
ncbi:hypothetical protein [Winogradskyella flava]|uniref:hypothetical protein n=1 Tax=Winogradskyella flava TaxID=1884876 RepID=UPI002491F0E5|nr:hypothetical protein [Winogradskyella flava]